MSRAWPVDNLAPTASVTENARRILAVRIAEFYSYEPIIPLPDYVEGLHDLRIAAKRLRYTLELFRPQFGREGQQLIESVRAVQEALGNLHDHDVRIELIGDELSLLAIEQSLATRASLAEASEGDLALITASALRPPPDDPRRGLIALLGREHSKRREGYVQFRQLWDELARQGMRQRLTSLSAQPLARLAAAEDVPA